MNKAATQAAKLGTAIGLLLVSLSAPCSTADTVAQSDAWLKLLHYQSDGWRGGVKSSVLSSSFFLADDGRSNPQAELLASLDAFRRGQALCQLPARSRFLSETLGESFPDVSCADFDKYNRDHQLEGVSFVYAAGRLDHPASVFGHGFLRLNIAGDRDPILDPVLNFTVQTGDDSTLKYLAIGLVGGYVGKFSTPPYYDLIDRHNRKELRDLWEYPIHLDNAELELLVAHYWEIKDAEFDYLFISENCITQIVALVEAVVPELDIMDKERGKVMPIQVLNGISRHSDRLGQPRHRSSLIQTINYREQFLNGEERRLVKQLASGSSEFSSLGNVQASRQAAVLDTAYDLAIYQQFVEGEDGPNPIADQIIAQRAALDSQFSWSPTPIPTRQPAGAHGSARSSIGITERYGDQALTFGWRFVYHDLLDPVSANPWGTEVEAWNFQLTAANGEVDIEQIDIVNIAQYARRGSLLQQPSFKTQLGFRRTSDGEDKEFYLDRATGWSWSRESWLAYTMLETDLAVGSGIDKGWRVGAGLRAGIYINPTISQIRPWAAHLSTVSTVGLLGEKDSLLNWKLEQQWSFSQHLGFRLSIGEGFRYAESKQVQRNEFAQLSVLAYW